MITHYWFYWCECDQDTWSISEQRDFWFCLMLVTWAAWFMIPFWPALERRELYAGVMVKVRADYMSDLRRNRCRWVLKTPSACLWSTVTSWMLPRCLKVSTCCTTCPSSLREQTHQDHVVRAIDGWLVWLRLSHHSCPTSMELLLQFIFMV